MVVVVGVLVENWEMNEICNLWIVVTKRAVKPCQTLLSIQQVLGNLFACFWSRFKGSGDELFFVSHIKDQRNA